MFLGCIQSYISFSDGIIEPPAMTSTNKECGKKCKRISANNNLGDGLKDCLAFSYDYETKMCSLFNQEPHGPLEIKNATNLSKFRCNGK